MPPLSNPRREKLAQVYARKMLSEKPENLSKTAIYQEAYPTASHVSAAARAGQALGNIEVVSRVKELVFSANPPQSIAKDLYKLRKAKKEVIGPDGNIVKLVDNGTRMSAVQTVLKVYGALNEGTQIDARQVSFNITPDTASRLDSALHKIEELSRKFSSPEARKLSDTDTQKLGESKA